MFDQLKQLNELRKQASVIKKELNEIVVEAEEENGTIKIVMNGEQKIQTLTIDPKWLAPDKKTQLEQVLKRCFTKAIEKTQQAVAAKLGPLAKNFM